MKTRKAIKQEQMLAAQEREEVIANALKFSKKRFKKFDEIILQLYLEKDLSSYFCDRRIWKIHECFSGKSAKGEERALLKNVFLYLHRYSSLMSGEDYIHTVFNMFKLRKQWIKDIFDWKPVSKRGGSQVHELGFYLFCQYKVPEFLYKGFYEKDKEQYIQWFIHIGTGKRARDLPNMPLPFTQRMAHYFLQAPAVFTISEALRWAQVKGMNGDDRLAERIAYSWIGSKPYEEEAFWESFLRILINGGLFNHEHLTQVIDYVRDSKRVNPAYTLKGRTLQSLLRQSEDWHKQAVLMRGNQLWNSCGIKEYRVDRKDECIVLEELTGSKLLAEEGRAMKHCVGTYANYCFTGRSAIFSFRRYAQGLMIERMATVEVNLSLRRIVQAKAKMNGKVSDEVRKHLQLWANRNNLSMGPYL